MLTMVSRKTRNHIRLVDGTHVVVHQCAANIAGGADKQAMGKTREGRNTMIMALADGPGLAVKLLLAEGQAYQGRHVLPLRGNLQGCAFLATKASTVFLNSHTVLKTSLAILERSARWTQLDEWRSMLAKAPA